MLQKQHCLVVALSLGCSLSSAQTFEVASVKASPVESSGRFTMNGGPGTADPGRISYSNVMLRRVLLNAYDVNNYQLIGPDWLNTLRYDINATVPSGASRAQFQLMLRNLLETRFRMRSHWETRELSVYALLVEKNGPKIKATAPAEKRVEDQLADVGRAEGRDGFPEVTLRTPGMVMETKNGAARITAKEVSMKKLADMLTGQAGRPVVDMSGPKGDFSFVLYFTPVGPNAGNSSEPGLFAALVEQLGLRLEARKVGVAHLVIDGAEKVPTEN